MPIYEYECGACGHQFEALVLQAGAPPCPSCQSTDLHRLTSLFAVSSQATRQSSLNAARRKNMPTLREQAVAEKEAIDHHRD